MTGDRERCLAAGMDGYLSKPVAAAQLFEVTEALVVVPSVAQGSETNRWRDNGDLLSVASGGATGHS